MLALSAAVLAANWSKSSFSRDTSRFRTTERYLGLQKTDIVSGQ
jgi:hypothetical protein